MPRRLALIALLLILAGCADADSKGGGGPINAEPDAAACERPPCRVTPLDAALCEADEQLTDAGACAIPPRRCARNGDCPFGELCDPATLTCRDMRALPRPCETVADCLADEACYQQLCAPRPSDGGALDAGGGADAAPAPDLGPPPSPDAGPPRLDAAPPPLDATPTLDVGPAADAALPGDAAPPIDAAPPVDATPPADAAPLPETPDPGVYDYVRLPLGGLAMVNAVVFHPSGDYALVLEAYDRVHVLTWPGAAITTITLDAPGRWFAFRDVVFTPDGSKALIVGVDDNDTGRIAVFDDAAYRAGEALPASLLLERPGEALVAIEYPWDDGPPVVLGKQQNGQGWIARVRDLDLEAGTFGDFVEGFGSTTGCDDFAFVNNEFGGPGIYVICGHNGADHRYYTWLGGVGAWSVQPGTNNTGNFVRIAAHRGGDYALVLADSGRGVFRFADGLLNRSEQAPRFPAVSNLAFGPLGRRALIVGGAGGVREYRHPRYDDIRDVSIGGWGAAPFNIPNARLTAVALHPHCDGGLVAGGRSDINGSMGLVARFDIVNGPPGRRCAPQP